jgi:hypothetical protein
MMTFQIRAAVLSRLGHATLGLNAFVAAACAANGIPDPPIFDLTVGSRQLVHGPAPLGALEIADRVAYPLVNIYGVAANNTRRSRPAEFSGVVTAAVDVWLGDYRIDQLALLENHTDAVEHALIASFNTLGANLWVPGAAISYDGELAMQRSSVVMVEANEVWRRPIRTQLTFLAVQP